MTPTSQTVGKRFRLKDDADVTKATQKLRLLKKLKCTLKYEKLAWAAGANLSPAWMKSAADASSVR